MLDRSHSPLPSLLAVLLLTGCTADSRTADRGETYDTDDEEEEEDPADDDDAAADSGDDDDATGVPSDDDDATADSGDDDDITEDDDDAAVDPCAQDGAFCVDVLVPSNYSGTARELAVGLYGSLPPFGPPDYTMAQVDSPSLSAGDVYEVVVDRDVPSVGAFHVYIALYDVDGGSFIPMADVDYTAETDALFFDGSAIDVGVVELEVVSWF